MSLIRSETGRFRRGEVPLTLVGVVWSVSLLMIVNTYHADPERLMRGFLSWMLLPLSAVLLFVGYGAWFRWLGRVIFVCGIGCAALVSWQIWLVLS